MFEISYACLAVRVIFVNACLVSVTINFSEGCITTSFFSKYLSKIVVMHGKNKYKLTVVSISAAANKAILNCIKSNHSILESTKVY